MVYDLALKLRPASSALQALATIALEAPTCSQQAVQEEVMLTQSFEVTLVLPSRSDACDVSCASFLSACPHPSSNLLYH